MKYVLEIETTDLTDKMWDVFLPLSHSGILEVPFPFFYIPFLVPNGGGRIK